MSELVSVRAGPNTGVSGIGCVSDDFSPATLERGARRSRIGNTARPFSRSNTNRRPVFVACNTAAVERLGKSSSTSDAGAVRP